MHEAGVKRVLLLVVGLGVLSAGPLPAKEPAQSPFRQIKIQGEDPRSGLFDLSVEYGYDAIGWLAYSRVSLPEYVETHIARSTDRGHTWSFVTAANHSEPGTMVIDGRPKEGVWRYEMPTLLFDPKDVPERRWKLFVHRYLAVPPYKKGNSLFREGGIVVQYATRPEGPWTTMDCLFGGVLQGCRMDLNALHPDLKNVVFYYEMGSILEKDVIYLSLDASPTANGLGDWKHRAIVLIASSDHGLTWRYVGTLTNYDDANALGYLTLTGSSLVRENGRLYLLVTPSGAKGLKFKNRGHDGTLVVEFDDIRQARLKRDAKGRLKVVKRLKPEFHSGGLSDYDEQNTRGGILFSQINLKTKPEFFQLFSTGHRIAGAPATANPPGAPPN